ncbi:MAG TPA: hypothetical protein VGY32_03040 [Solirubrobacteraceae bacterium]|jgi:hypothetical protein|nr:hypothetical protein [Solirubrobacteraceae bacterium]
MGGVRRHIPRLLACVTLSLLGLTAGAGAEGVQTAQPPNASYCDNFDPTVCLQPFPNNYFTALDPSTPTGRRINFNVLAMPRNAVGRPIDPTEWNRADGFSPGSLITVHIPGLDNQQALDSTGGVPLNNLPAYQNPGAPMVVIDATDPAHPRWPIWTEMDSQSSNDSVRNLIIRPARNFTERHRYVVALRDLKDSQGQPIPAPAVFAAFRDHPCSHCNPGQPYPGGETARTAHMESIFRTLRAAGIPRRSLYLAWDFTVASERSLTQRMLHIRDDAFGQLGESPQQLGSGPGIPASSTPPRFVVTSVTNYTPAQNSQIARQVQGRYYVPCYLNTPGCASGGSFFFPPGSQVPAQLPGNTYEAKFVCNIPWAAMTSPARPGFYGHGLFGDRFEINQDQLQRMANEHDFVFCATEEAGMACATDTPPTDPTQLLAEAQKGVLPESPNCDIPNVVTAISDVSRFNTVVDRLQEGILAELYLGRVEGHPHGFVSDPAFQTATGRPVIDTSSQVYYDGNSQGGIMGGAVAAVMVDGTRATIGVPGMNYSTLLQRSTDFGTGSASEGPPNRVPDQNLNGLPTYAWLVYKAYPAEADRQVMLALMQMLWDRGEADGYAEHATTNPLPNTPAHKVLMHVAFGDHQVSDFAAAVEARTIGAYIHWPALDPQRDPTGGSQYFGLLPHIPSYPWNGSAIVVWDAGQPNADCSLGVGAPPFTNTPPVDGCPSSLPPSQWGANDPHEFPRRTPAARQQKSDFDEPSGVVNDTCGGAACHTYNFSGIP